MAEKVIKNVKKIKKMVDFKYEIKDKSIIKYIKNLKFNCDYSYNTYNVKSKKVNKKIYNELMDLKIKDFVKKYIKEYCIYENIYTKSNIEITIYSKTKNNINLINEIDSIINMFKKISTNTKKYKILILLIDVNKKINNKYNYPKDVNSGVNKRSMIILFRKEEIHKVLIHELIHYTLMDCFINSSKLNYITNSINIKWLENSLYSNEFITEYLAVVYFTIWKYRYNEVKGNIINYMNKQLINENIFNMLQVAKICKLEGYKSYSELFKKPFVQESRVLSYIFVRNHLLKEPKFLKLLIL